MNVVAELVDVFTASLFGEVFHVDGGGVFLLESGVL